MPFTHKVLAYCEASKELRDSQQREESAAKAWELAKSYAETLSQEDCECSWRPTVHVEVIPASK